MLEEFPPELLAQMVYSDQPVLESGTPCIVPSPDICKPDGRAGETSQLSIEGPKYRGESYAFVGRSANSSLDHVIWLGG